MSLLHADTNVLTKAILNKLKVVLSTLMSSQKTTYIKNRLSHG